ncbi:unnamed protein product, partial [Closterium sp. Naga37s-1]
VLGVADLLLRTPLTVEQRSYLEIIRSSGDNLLRIISDVLDLSKIESQSLGLESVAYCLETCINEATALLCVAASEKGLLLESRVAPDVPRYVRGDPGRLRQIILNLVSNSIKFTQSGGIQIVIRRATEDEVTRVRKTRAATAASAAGEGADAAAGEEGGVGGGGGAKGERETGGPTAEAAAGAAAGTAVGAAAGAAVGAAAGAAVAAAAGAAVAAAAGGARGGKGIVDAGGTRKADPGGVEEEPSAKRRRIDGVAGAGERGNGGAAAGEKGEDAAGAAGEGMARKEDGRRGGGSGEGDRGGEGRGEERRRKGRGEETEGDSEDAEFGESEGEEKGGCVADRREAGGEGRKGGESGKEENSRRSAGATAEQGEKGEEEQGKGEEGKEGEGEQGEKGEKGEKGEEGEEKVWITFCVVDTGMGISQEACSRLFRAFMQGDASTSRRYGGTGLGLAISKSLVNIMGGDIHVSSQVGAGSTFAFTIQLPVSTAQLCALAGNGGLMARDDSLAGQFLLGWFLCLSWFKAWGRGGFKGCGGVGARSTFAFTIQLPISTAQLCALAGNGGLMARDDSLADSAFTIQLPVSTAQLCALAGNGGLMARDDSLAGGLGLGCEEERKKRRKGLACLIAEDNKVNQMVVVRMLRGLGVVSDVASNGEEALRACEKKDYDVVFMVGGVTHSLPQSLPHSLPPSLTPSLPHSLTHCHSEVPKELCYMNAPHCPPSRPTFLRSHPRPTPVSFLFLSPSRDCHMPVMAGFIATQKLRLPHAGDGWLHCHSEASTATCR